MDKNEKRIEAAKPREFYGEIAKTLPNKGDSRKVMGAIVAGYLWRRLFK